MPGTETQEAHTLVRARGSMGARAAAASALPGAAALPTARSDLEFLSVATAASWETTHYARLAPTPSSDPGCGAAGARTGAWEEPVLAATAAATAPATTRRPGARAAACDPVLALEAAAATPAAARRSSCGSAIGEAVLAPAAVAAATPAAARRLSSGVMAGEPILAVASAAATPATAVRSSGGVASAPTPCLMTPATGARRVEGMHPTPNPGSMGATPAPRLLVQFLPRDATAAQRVAAAGGIPHLELDCKCVLSTTHISVSKIQVLKHQTDKLKLYFSFTKQEYWPELLRLGTCPQGVFQVACASGRGRFTPWHCTRAP